MSIHLMSLVWEVPFPTPTQKLLMLRIADYADDEGGGIFPSIDLLSRQAGAKERQTQYALKALEQVDLLSKITGAGPKGTNLWSINVDLLLKLAFHELILEGKHDSLQAVENGGANIAPRTLQRVQSAALRVQSATEKGATHCTQSTINHHLDPSGASAGARDGSRTSPAVRKVRPRFDLTPNDGAKWLDWIDHLRKSEKPELADAAIANGKIAVTSKWPKPEEGIQGVIDAGPANYTSRMLGERN